MTDAADGATREHAEQPDRRRTPAKPWPWRRASWILDEVTTRGRPELRVVVGILVLLAGLAGGATPRAQGSSQVLSPLGVAAGVVYGIGLVHWVAWCTHRQRLGERGPEVVPPLAAGVVALATTLSLIDAAAGVWIGTLPLLDALCNLGFLLASGNLTLALLWSALPGEARGRGFYLPRSVGLMGALHGLWGVVAAIDRRLEEAVTLLLLGGGAALIALGLAALVPLAPVCPPIRAAWRPSLPVSPPDGERGARPAPGPAPPCPCRFLGGWSRRGGRCGGRP